MSDDQINIEVDGKSVKAKKGQMIIEATDEHGSYVPRFCYHSKLSIAANCRMCLVEVEKAPKPLPACATPVADGMKIFTKSPFAIAAQKATMEFLLINHPWIAQFAIKVVSVNCKIWRWVMAEVSQGTTTIRE